MPADSFYGPFGPPDTSPTTVVTPAGGYSGVYAWIRSRLQDSVNNPDGTPAVPDAYFDQDIRSEIRRLLSPFPSQAYAAITGEDRANADEAIGLYVAIRLQVPLSTGGLVAPITYENVTTTGNARITRQTAQISNTATGLDERTRWKAEADAAWSRVSFVGADFASPPSAVVTNRTRSVSGGGAGEFSRYRYGGRCR